MTAERDSAAPASGFLGNSRFELLSRLGAGGMGVVYEALDRTTGQRVALKILSVPTPRAILNFKREFRTAQSVSHRNLVDLKELHGEEGQWFFTMELLEGSDVLAHVRPADGVGAGRLDASRLRSCLTQLTDAVDAIHAAGFLHRDIKPANLRVTPEGRLVLLDFGMATNGEDPEDDRDIVGTTEYMAPEQAAARPLGPPADWYAVGAVLYHALVGRPPFEGAGLDVLVRKQQEVPVSPRAIDPAVPEDLDRLCLALLLADPRRRPTPHTIARGIPAAARAATSVSLGRPGSFVGRAAELEVLAAALVRAQSGPSLVVVSGASGVGKSALAHHFADVAAAHDGAVTLLARCRERETIAGGGIDGLVDSLARYLRGTHRDQVAALLPRRAHLLAQTYPVLRTVDAFTRAPRDDDALVDPFTRRARLVGALRELLGRLADRWPVTIVLDDAQWADAETMSMLDSLLQPPDAPGMLVIATWRPVTDDDAMPAMLAGALQVTLSPLDQAATETLAAELFARAVTTKTLSLDAATLARESGGHPLLLDALIQHALASGATSSGGGTVTLREAIAARLDALDPVPRQVFDVLVIAGLPADEDLLARATGAPAIGVARALSTLRIHQLTRSARRGDRILAEPYHDQIRTVGLELLGPGRRRTLHAAFANALEAQGNPDPDLLVAHLREAGDDAAAARHAVHAAELAARSLAFHRAAHLYGVTLQLSTAGAAELRPLRLARADVLAAAGRGAEAAVDYLACAEGAPAAERLELQRQAAQQLLVTGHTAEGLATIRVVLAAEGLAYPATARRAVVQIAWRRLRLATRGLRMKPRDLREITPRELARIDVCWHVGLGLSIVDTMRGHAFHVLGILLALRAGEPRRLGRALALDIAYRGTAGGPATAKVEALFEVAHRMAIEHDDSHALGVAIGCRGVAAFLRGDWADGARWCNEAESIFVERCRGVPWELATSKLFGARSQLAMGDVIGLATRTELAIRDCQGRGDLYGETSLRAAILPFVHLLRADRDAATEESDRALDRWSPVGYQIQHYYQLVSRCSVHLYAGEPERGLALMEQAWPSIRTAMFLRVQLIRVTLHDLRARLHVAAARGDDRDRHLRAATRLARTIAAERMGWTTPLAATIQAAVAARSGRGDAAIAYLHAATAGFGAAQMALHAASAQRRLGELLGGDEGDALLSGADHWFAEHAVASPPAIVTMLIGSGE